VIVLLVVLSGVLSRKDPQITVLFVRCLDCDRFHELTCDTAIGVDLSVRSDDFQRFAEFLVEHSGHRIAAKAETSRGGAL
jgi:hypothetical protein